MSVCINMSDCPKCRHAWAYSVIYQQLTVSGKFVIQHLMCDYCPYSTKRTVKKGQEDPDVAMCMYDCAGRKRAYSEVDSDSN